MFRAFAPRLPLAAAPARASWPALPALLALLLAPPQARGFEHYFGGDRSLQLHGFTELQLRTLSDGFAGEDFYLSQWSNVLNLEAEMDIAPEGFGPFDLVSGFVRAEVRINCVFKSACGTSTSYRFFGDEAERAPADNFTDGTTTGFAGRIEVTDPESPFRRREVHTDGTRFVDISSIPPFDRILEIGNPERVRLNFAPVLDARFAVKQIDRDNSRGPRVLPLGPWPTDFTIEPNGALRSVGATTDPALPPGADDSSEGALLLRPNRGGGRDITKVFDGEGNLVGLLPAPDAERLFTPSHALSERMHRFGTFDQNLSENELFWNHGASQDEKELREAYLDIEMLDHRLWLRIGKQTIVWGKTELFRTTDQFNPQDLAISSLPSLEESRIPLWSLRGVYSLYNVGPLDDVRLELAFNYDDFEPVDLGRCGEPYTIFLVCGKSTGLFGHGTTGLGLAGEERPPDPWHGLEGLEIGGRVEFRWDRFSFAISDFWGYSDAPYIFVFNTYGRDVDPETGRPLDVFGQPFEIGDIGPVRRDDESFAPDDPRRLQRDALRSQARELHPGNRQLYDVFCAATIGIAQNAAPALSDSLGDACLLDFPNNRVALPQDVSPVPVSIAEVTSLFLTGSAQAELLLGQFVTASVGGAGDPVPLFELSRDSGDNVIPASGRLDDFDPPRSSLCFSIDSCLSTYLSVEQQALLGCGPFYGTSCDLHGVDLFNAEGSVLFQALPGFEPEGPVATRYAPGLVSGQDLVQLPGARGPFEDAFGTRLPDGQVNPSYDPAVDGCITPDVPGCEGSIPGDNGATLSELGFRSETQALSENFVRFIATLAAGLAAQEDPDTPCVAPGQPGYDPMECELLLVLVNAAGVQRPEVIAGGNGRFGRRDFLWHGGGEAVLRYNKRNVLGFAADFAEDVTKTNWSLEFTWFADSVFTDNSSLTGVSESDVFNLTLSMDRLTFINFLNPHRTFFFNTQWFFRYIDDYNDDGRYAADGPFSVLGTLNIATAYRQDRLIPSVTLVHDFWSNSGGVIPQITYRYTEVFSVGFGVAIFYGGPERVRIPISQLSLSNQGPPYRQRLGYNGLSPIAERDEIFLRLRYTF